MAAPAPFNAADLKRRMTGAVDALKHDFGGLRTGRASTSLLDPIMVDAYGAKTPIAQVGSVAVPEPRLLQITVWDRGLVIAVEKAIQQSNLGLNLHVTIPVKEHSSARGSPRPSFFCHVPTG